MHQTRIQLCHPGDDVTIENTPGQPPTIVINHDCPEDEPPVIHIDHCPDTCFQFCCDGDGHPIDPGGIVPADDEPKPDV